MDSRVHCHLIDNEVRIFVVGPVQGMITILAEHRFVEAPALHGFPGHTKRIRFHGGP